jgi:hypothetical protein
MSPYHLGLLHGVALICLPSFAVLSVWVWLAGECAEIAELCRYVQPPEPIDE